MPRHSRISIDLLETLVTLIDAQGDAAEAMRQLDINQPSMSKRLAMLQHRHDTIPTPWLTRDGKTWKLTEAGERYFPAAREIVYRQQMLENSIVTNHPFMKRVWLCCGEEAVRSFIRPAVEEFRKRKPDTRLCVSVLSPAARITAVANGAADMATVTHDDESTQRIAGRRLHIEILTEDRLAIAIGKKARKELKSQFDALIDYNVRLKQVAEFPLILPAPDGGTRVRLDEAFAEAKVKMPLNIVAELEGWQTLIEYVATGMGVAILPESAIKQHGSALVVKWLDSKALQPTTTKLICRYKADSSQELNLEPDAMLLRQLLLDAARR
jgi:LysR family nitrogen assimilation transcriptional regulator